MDVDLVNNEVIFLQDKLKGYHLTGAENKFDEKGNPLFFPGCTIIFNIPIDTDLSSEIFKFQNKLRELNPPKTYFYLPRSSFHMTLFDCCNLNTENTEYWPKNINNNLNYNEIANKLSKRIQNYSLPNKVNLKLNKFYGGYSMILEPFSEEDENILRNCRDELSKLLKIKFKNHQKYTFHITLAYILRKLTQEEINNLLKVNKNLLDEFVKKFPKIVLKDPTVCTFENMLEFKSINSSSQ